METPIYHLEAVVKAKAQDLEDFVGPLDLILHLLSKNKMEIKDIQLSLILHQYLLWMEGRKRLDLEVASEFVAMASHLVDIKTRMLLSVHDEEVTSEMEALIASLEAHRNNETYLRIKKVAPQLLIQYRHGQNLLTKEAEVLSKAPLSDYDHETADLWRAMHAVLSRVEVKKPVEVGAFQGIVGREPYPVAQKAMELVNLLQEQGSCSFAELFYRSQSRSELVATFIALLDLCKNNRLVISSRDLEEEEWTVSYVEPATDGQEMASHQEQEV